MRTRIESLSPRSLAIVAAASVILYAAVVWVLIVSPKRAEAADARSELAAAELQLAEAQAAANRPRGAGAPVSDVFRLAKAMPASTDQPGLVLELTRLAKRSGVTLRSVSQQTLVAGAGGPTLIPLTVIVGGSYSKITKFLLQTRRLVAVRNGRIHARGRLLTVESVSLVESVADGFPKLDATVVLNAYVYDGPIVPIEVPDGEPEEEPSSGGTSAAGSTN